MPLEDVTYYRNMFIIRVQKNANDLLGKAKHKHQNWFDENNQNLQNLLQSKAKAYQALMQARANMQREMRTMKNKWWMDIATELKNLADRNDARSLYKALKLLMDPQSMELFNFRLRKILYIIRKV